MKWPEHGGQPKQLQQELHSKNGTVLDFSANINPLGPPSWLEAAAIEALKDIAVYPDPDYSKAVKSIAESEGLAEENVLLTNGGAEAIFLAARLIAGGTALLVEPSFREYSRACAHYDIKVERLSYQENEFPVQETINNIKNVDAVFICRPHNPSGTVVPVQQMREVLENAGEAYVFADEAFVDFLPEQEKLTNWLRKYPNLVLLRSFTKMFAIPGLRSGCVLASADVLERMKQWQIPWSVNAVSAALVPQMTADRQFVNHTVSWLAEEIGWLKSSINQKRWKLSDTKVNFYLLQDRKLNDHEPLLRFLLEEGIAVRHTYNFSGIDGGAVRAAVRSREENTQLVEALRCWEERV